MSELKKEVLDIVKSRYEILDSVDLLAFDSQLDALDSVLSQYANYKFDIQQRIIILHNDTDYYTSLQSSGFTLYNLFLLIKKYNIPTEALIIFTNHHGIHNEITKLASQICHSTSIKVVYTELWGDYPDDKCIPLAEKDYKVNNVFCCLNGVSRSHRILTLCYLQEYNLLSKGMVSYHFNL